MTSDCRRTIHHSSTKPVSSDSSRADAWIPCQRICCLATHCCPAQLCVSVVSLRLLSENYYNPKWSGFRRLKNTCVVAWRQGDCAGCGFTWDVHQRFFQQRFLHQICRGCSNYQIGLSLKQPVLGVAESNPGTVYVENCWALPLCTVSGKSMVWSDQSEAKMRVSVS